MWLLADNFINNNYSLECVELYIYLYFNESSHNNWSHYTDSVVLVNWKFIWNKIDKRTNSIKQKLFSISTTLGAKGISGTNKLWTN